MGNSGSVNKNLQNFMYTMLQDQDVTAAFKSLQGYCLLIEYLNSQSIKCVIKNRLISHLIEDKIIYQNHVLPQRVDIKLDITGMEKNCSRDEPQFFP